MDSILIFRSQCLCNNTFLIVCILFYTFKLLNTPIPLDIKTLINIIVTCIDISSKIRPPSLPKESNFNLSASFTIQSKTLSFKPGVWLTEFLYNDNNRPEGRTITPLCRISSYTFGLLIHIDRHSRIILNYVLDDSDLYFA